MILHQRPARFIAATLALSGAILIGLAPTSVAQSNAEILAEMQKMKARIAELESRLAATQKTADAAEEKATAATEAVESVTSADGSVAAVDMPVQQGWWDQTSLGGYGEMHLTLGDKEEVDFHRYVLFVEHQFNDFLRFVSEIELEHSIAGDGKNGEFELEQAYVEMDLGNGFAARGGLFLIPVGIINEFHEPPTFFGTERNYVEREIIPSTWWEGGLGLNKKFDSGLAIDLSVHSGLDVPTTGSSAYRIRSGRQKVSEAPADGWASTLNVEYNGIPGIGVGASAQYQTDISQTTSGETNSAWLSEAHVDIQRGNFGLRSLYGRWDISGHTPALLGLDTQYGFYVEPSYTFQTGIGDVGLFARWTKLDAAKLDSDIYDIGLNFWPHENVVLKADYTKIQDAEDDDFINFGIGFQF